MRKLAVFVLMSLLALAVLQASAVASGPMAPDDVSLAGTVSDALGAAISGAEVVARNVANGSEFSSLSNQLGGYNVTLPAGTYNVSASLPRYGANITYAMLQVTDDMVGLDFTMTELPGTVSGFVTSGDAPVPGVRITLSKGGLNYSGNTTAPFGRYDISGVLPGVYVAKAEKGGYWTSFAPAPVFVVGGEGTILNFTLLPQPVRVFGIVSVGGEVEEGVSVHMLSQGVAVKETLTDSRGNFTISGVPAGDYTLVFKKDGLEDKSVLVSLEPFADQRVDVSMTREPVQGGEGFINDLDLTHSMMVVGLIVSLLLMLFALFIRMRGAKRPELLAKEEEEPEEKKKGK